MHRRLGIATVVSALVLVALGSTVHAENDSSVQAVHETIYVEIGGVEQWVEILGDNHANPVLLILNGGPGATLDPLTPLFKEWETYFTLVIWDQRGAGRTYSREAVHHSSDITIQQIASDGIELAQYLSNHFNGRKIIVLGHSWGSLIGIRMIQQSPNLFAAYVGTGQIVDTARAEVLDYEIVMGRAGRARNQTAINELRAIGPPPYVSASRMGMERKWATLLAVKSERPFNDFDYIKKLFPPDFSVKDMADRIAGSNFSNAAVYGESLDGEITSINLLSTATQLAVPVVFIQGADDDVTPTSLVREYFKKLHAPSKNLVVLAGEGHLAVFAAPNTFLKQLRWHVLPLIKIE
jgi:pimeloyl-ACP methyl ester carboxylesterase